MFSHIQFFIIVLKVFESLVPLIWGGSMLNNLAPLYVKPIHFNLGFSGTLRSFTNLFTNFSSFKIKNLSKSQALMRKINLNFQIRVEIGCGFKRTKLFRKSQHSNSCTRWQFQQYNLVTFQKFEHYFCLNFIFTIFHAGRCHRSF